MTVPFDRSDWGPLTNVNTVFSRALGQCRDSISTRDASVLWRVGTAHEVVGGEPRRDSVHPRGVKELHGSSTHLSLQLGGLLELLHHFGTRRYEKIAALIERTGRIELHLTRLPEAQRSEERRVGKECRSRWSPY